MSLHCKFIFMLFSKYLQIKINFNVLYHFIWKSTSCAHFIVYIIFFFIIAHSPDKILLNHQIPQKTQRVPIFSLLLQSLLYHVSEDAIITQSPSYLLSGSPGCQFAYEFDRCELSFSHRNGDSESSRFASSQIDC